MLISVVIVSYNTSAILHQCLDALFEDSGSHDLEVFVVDNDSSDDSVEMVRNSFPQVLLTANKENLGFAAANNQAYEKSKGDYVILLNPDAFIRPGSIDAGVQFMESHPECGLCGGRLITPEGILDPSARKFPNFFYKFLTISGISSRFPDSAILARYDFGGFDHQSTIEVDWVPGTFTVFRREMLKKLGLFDERFFLYYEETDLCLQAKRNGWKAYFLPTAEVIHVGGASSKTRKDLDFDPAASQVLKFRLRSEFLYFRKNYGFFSVLANAGVEIGWHLARFAVNFLPHRRDGKKKRVHSISLIRQIVTALKDTQYGAFSPPRPW